MMRISHLSIHSWSAAQKGSCDFVWVFIFDQSEDHCNHHYYPITRNVDRIITFSDYNVLNRSFRGCRLIFRES